MSLRGKRLLLVLALPAGLYLLLYLLPANLLLQNPGLFSRNPERLRIGWGSAWTLLPGRVAVRGLRVEGGPRVRWSLAVEEGRGRFALAALIGREFHLRGFEARGVEIRVVREPAPSSPAVRKKPRRRPWTVWLEGVRLDEIRTLEYGPLRLEGNGRAAGMFRLVIGKETELDLENLDMSGRLLAKDRPVAQAITLRAGLRFGPYARQQRGAAALDFLSGNLDLTGDMIDLPVLRRASKGALPGRIDLALKVEKGALLPGSRAEIAPPASEGSAMTIRAAVTPGGLRLAADLKGFSLPRKDGLPPLLESDRLHVTAVTPEVRLSRLLARRSDRVLAGEIQAERFRLIFPGRRASLEISADRGTGRIDLPSLLRREVRLAGLKAEGAHLRLTRGGPARETQRAAGRGRWSARLANVQLDGDGEVSLGSFRLDGKLQVAGGMSWSGGELAIDRASLTFSDGRLQSRGKTVAQGLGLRSEARLAAFAPGRVKGLEILRLVSGRANVEGVIASLGFLQPYLAKASWLTLDGNGTLRADLALESGRLLPGSRFAIKPARLVTNILLSRATGSAEMTGAVAKKKDGDELDIQVLFDQFEVAAREIPGARPHVRGRGLRMSLATRNLDLASPGQEIRARIDLPAAEVSNLAHYNAYLAPESPLEIVSGTGVLRLWLEMNTAGPPGRGEMSLTSPAVVARLHDLELAGVLDIQTRLSNADLKDRRFALDGTRLLLNRVSLREIGADAEEARSAPGDWWARLDLTSASMDLAKPLSLTSTVQVAMKDSGLLLALFSRRKRYLGWFKELLTVEDIRARGDLRLGQGALVLDPLVATGTGLELRTRLRLSKERKRGCLFVRHGRKAVGVELRDGQRDFKLLRPEKWFQTCGPP